MKDLEEFRYPFDIAPEFFAKYWHDAAALHLDFAWIVLLVLGVRVLLQKRPAGQKLLALYFSLTLFNNPAFQLVQGATLGDLLGVGCLVYGLCKAILHPERRFSLSPVGTSVCAAGMLLTLHALFVSLLYPVLNNTAAYLYFSGSSIGLTRALVLFKVFVFGLCCWLFDRAFERESDMWWLIRQVVNFALIGVVAYLLQIGLLLTGTIPYGTFFDAGYVGFPSFGSVSIERGHFGKFLTPLFPMFLLAFLKGRRRLAFFSFLLVTLINFSASSLSFFAAYAAHTVWQYRRKLLLVKYAALAVALAVCLGGFILATWSLWAGLLTKIDDQAIEGGTGGRSIGLLLSYLRKYPLGLSYGGSSLRTPPDLDEMNSGLNSFIAQTSLLSIPLMVAFFFLVFTALKRCRHIADLATRRALQTGVLVMPFIFFSDLLWFVPTIWLPLLTIFRLTTAHRQQSRQNQERLGQAVPEVRFDLSQPSSPAQAI